jgi:hypothetical protein
MESVRFQAGRRKARSFRKYKQAAAFSFVACLTDTLHALNKSEILDLKIKKIVSYIFLL